MMRRWQVLGRLTAAVLVTAAVGAAHVSTAPPASAATCSSGSGVSVVVDFGALGGGVQAGCVAGGGGQAASSLFRSAGFDLAYVQNQPGFVCRINQLPSSSVEACVNTPPEDAYWALWWSDGTSGSWSYSNYGVGTLKVPDGAYVGFAWQTGSKSPPNLSPEPHASTPTPTPTPTTTPTSGGGAGNGGNGHGSATPTVKPSSKPSSSSSPTTTRSPSESGSVGTPSPVGQTDSSTVETPTEAPTEAPTASDTLSATPSSASSEPAPQSDSASITPTAAPSDGADGSGGALPAWVVPVLIVFLALAGAAITVLRRRIRPSL
jgi:hypothetical protein